MQVKLLRVIQEKSVRPVGSQQEIPTDVRILSASHKNLLEEIEQRNFRQDLYYRINVIELGVPPLRERQEDIEEISSSILRRIAAEHGSSMIRIDEEALEALRGYSFPGNVRELENILHRAAALSENSWILAEHLDLQHPAVPQPPQAQPSLTAAAAGQETPAVDLSRDFSLEQHLEGIERDIINQALEQTRWNKTAAAKKLGMSFRSLRYRLKKLDLE